MASLLLISAAIAGSAIGAELKISNVDDFILFGDNVNKGTSYSGTTVLLDSDMDLTGRAFEPIGTSSKYFCEIFDGQGHTITGLEMNSSLQYVGLFGYSKGVTIRNVILDSSCTITSSYSGSSDVYAGGIIGYCTINKGPCTIENNVNMASVSFTGSTSATIHLSGVIGYLYFSIQGSTMKNCANYGDVVQTGESGSSYLGGIVGNSYGSSSARGYIRNSLNYGTITRSETVPGNFRIGGIVGESIQTIIENCVSAGKILSSKTERIGSIVGIVNAGTSISYCYATSELNGYQKYNYMYFTPAELYILSYDSTTFELDETVSVGSYTGTSLLDALNVAADYYTVRDYSHWLLNRNKNTMTFTINGNTVPISLNYQIILTPSLASEGSIGFDGWYEDSTYATPLTSYEVTGDTVLYEKWEENTNSYTITFDTRREGVTVAQTTEQFGSVVTLPSDLTTDSCSVAFWETEYGDNVGLSLTVPAYDITLHAVWKCTHIRTPEDLADFSKIVNSGTDRFSGTTVFLDSDLDFTGKTLEPIGQGTYNYFLGTFDGQGHVISNLAITSSKYAGLFGCSYGLTIRNVILDSSCSVASSYKGHGDSSVGG